MHIIYRMGYTSKQPSCCLRSPRCSTIFRMRRPFASLGLLHDGNTKWLCNPWNMYINYIWWILITCMQWYYSNGYGFQSEVVSQNTNSQIHCKGSAIDFFGGTSNDRVWEPLLNIPVSRMDDTNKKEAQKGVGIHRPSEPLSTVNWDDDLSRPCFVVDVGGGDRYWENRSE